MDRDEEKHWSKAMAAVLCWVPGQANGRKLPVANLLALLHSSRRYGSLSKDQMAYVVLRSQRFDHIWETDPTMGPRGGPLSWSGQSASGLLALTL